MELLQLRHFCDAAKTENFSTTAKRFSVPPSAVSQSIRRLETELGASLFTRRANTVSLNATGEEFYKKAEKGKLIFTQVGRQYRGKRYADILDVWLFSYDGEVDLGKATTQEVAQVKWMTKDKIRELFDTEKMVFTLEYFITDSRI
jgi:hypothetical protein